MSNAREVSLFSVAQASSLISATYCGIDAVTTDSTNGEFRRTYFHIDFLTQLGG